MSTAASPTGASFLRRRGARVALGAASVAGLSLLTASPAFAATDADCTDANTVDAGAGGTLADIQSLLDADTAVICLGGVFDVSTTLTFDYELTLYGLSGAVLDGGGDTQILRALSEDAVTVQNLVFSNGSASDGGAISAYDVTTIDSRFESNEAFLGGAISAYSVVSEGSTFVDNTAELGGAIQTYDFADISTSTFTDNGANYGGAVFSYGYVGIDSSTFEGNFAEGAGGAVLADEEFWVVNSTFVGNTVAEGAGGAINGDYGTVLQSTFLDNTADTGQALYSWDDGVVEVRGNIFSGASSSAQIDGFEEATVTDLGGNLFSTTAATETFLSDVQSSTGFGLPVALLFDGATLADNGGPTETVALYAGSPAVDAVPVGEPSVTVDQRGVPRDARSDAGAYEYVPAPAPQALAATGSTTAGWAAAAAGALLAAGAAVIATARRRRA